MSKDEGKQDARLKNTSHTEDASPKKDTENLVEVRKTDDAEDKDNEFIHHEKPFDEQGYQSFDDLRRDHRDEDSD